MRAVFICDGKTIATARIVGRTWLLSIPGHQWAVTPDMPVARFNKIPGDKITKVSVKGFPSKASALAEVKTVLAIEDCQKPLK
jgi:hypothetical protein